MSWLDIFAGQVLNFLSLFQQPFPGRFIPKPISLCWSLCRVGDADHWPVTSHYQALYQLAIFLQAGLHRTQLSDAKLIFSRESQNPSLVFPKVFSVELCHVIAIFQVTSSLLPLHLAHLCFSPVCVCWSFTTSVANHYLLCSFRVRSLEDLSPDQWELGGVLRVAVVTAWQGVGRLERAEAVKTSLPGKNLSFHAQKYCPLQIAIT